MESAPEFVGDVDGILEGEVSGVFGFLLHDGGGVDKHFGKAEGFACAGSQALDRVLEDHEKSLVERDLTAFGELIDGGEFFGGGNGEKSIQDVVEGAGGKEFIG